MTESELALRERLEAVAVELETRQRAFRATGIGDAYCNSVTLIRRALDPS